MEVFLEKLQQDSGFLIQTILIGVNFVLFLVLLFFNLKMKQKVKRVTHNQDGMTIETIINQYYTDIKDIQSTQVGLLKKQEEIATILERCISKIGIVRFNPFDEVGGDQSFAIALLDHDNNGIVLSSLYGRNNSRFYGKPVSNAGSTYVLSEEEEEAIKRAIAVEKE